jgi:molybdate transport system ATP-binding protein
MIQAKIRKQYPPSPDAAGFSLDIEFRAADGVTVLFGSSGAGKTLTLDCIAGFVRPDQGRILLDDQILFDGAAGVHLPPRSRHCGYVFQNYALFPHMTLRQNLEFAAERTPRLGRHRKVTEMLEKFRLGEVAGRRPYQLSGGQKQRCSIARALIGASRVLLLDEPTSGLDAPLRAELYSVLRQVRQEFGTPMLLVTHDTEECFTLADEMIVLRDGRAVQTGTPRKVFERPANADVARLLGLYNVLPVEIRSLDPGRNTSRPLFPRPPDWRPGLFVCPAGSAFRGASEWPAGVQSDPRHAASDGAKAGAPAAGVFRRNCSGGAGGRDLTI